MVDWRGGLEFAGLVGLPGVVGLPELLSDLAFVEDDAGVEGLQRIRLADAADVDVRARCRTAPLHQVHVRHRALQPAEVFRAFYKTIEITGTSPASLKPDRRATAPRA